MPNPIVLASGQVAHGTLTIQLIQPDGPVTIDWPISRSPLARPTSPASRPRSPGCSPAPASSSQGTRPVRGDHRNRHQPECRATCCESAADCGPLLQDRCPWLHRC
jgi:hypothetical protein